jgi:hypothetical protein
MAARGVGLLEGDAETAIIPLNILRFVGKFFIACGDSRRMFSASGYEILSNEANRLT